MDTAPQKPKAHLLHGYNVTDSGKGTVNKLAPYLERMGYEVVKHDFGWRGLFAVRFFNGRRVAKLAARVDAGDIAVGHSDGCNIINRAAHAGAPFHRVVYINPALNSDTPLAPHVESSLVFASRNDWVVKVARWLPMHPWGDMGADGPSACLERYKVAFHPYGHSGIFKSKLRVLSAASHIKRFLS